MHLFKPFPDELLGSALLRAARDLGLSSRRLLGAIKGVKSYTLPMLITQERTIAHSFGMSLEELLFGHSLMPYAIAFMCTDVRERVLRSVLSNVSGGTSPVVALGRSSTWFSAFLQFCQGCILADTHQYGVAYWHREHQLPRVAVCLRHRQALRVSDLRISRGRGIVLPDEVASSREIPLLVPKRIGTLIARFSYRALAGKLPKRDWTIYYRECAAELGFGHDAKFLARSLLAGDLHAFYGVQFLESLGLSFELTQYTHGWPTRMFCPGDRNFSPLCHVLLNIFLENVGAASKPVEDLFTRLKLPNGRASLEDEVLRQLEELLAEYQAAGRRVRLRDFAQRLHSPHYLMGLRRRYNMPRLVKWIEDFKASDLACHKTGGRTNRHRKAQKKPTE